MSAFQGLSFLLIVVGVMAIGITVLVLRERRRGKPRHTVTRFASSRTAMRDIFRHHERGREQARERARKAHPARKPRNKRSA